MVCFFTTFHSNTVFKSFFVTRKLVRYYYLFNNYFNDINWIHRTMKCKLFNTNITKFFTSFYIIKKLKNIMIKFSFLCNILYFSCIFDIFVYLFVSYLFMYIFLLVNSQSFFNIYFHPYQYTKCSIL